MAAIDPSTIAVFIAQIPTSDVVAGWETVGIVGFLAAAIMVLLYAFFGGEVVPRQVHEDVIGAERSMRERAEEESSQTAEIHRQNSALVRRLAPYLIGERDALREAVGREAPRGDVNGGEDD